MSKLGKARSSSSSFLMFEKIELASRVAAGFRATTGIAVFFLGHLVRGLAFSFFFNFEKQGVQQTIAPGAEGGSLKLLVL